MSGDTMGRLMRRRAAEGRAPSTDPIDTDVKGEAADTAPDTDAGAMSDSELLLQEVTVKPLRALLEEARDDRFLDRRYPRR